MLSLRKWALPVLFSATSLLSAFLLFWCQPLMAKALLPLLGGAPSVWNTAMLFFQTVLLAGYIYAHLLARLARRGQAILHGAVLAAGLLALPFGDATNLAPPAHGSPLLWLLGTLAATAGLPFFALSASAPLVQSWFKRTSHDTAGDPYFLYAASNAGSLAALLSFPFLLEPSMTVLTQGRAWAAGFALLMLLLGVCLAQARKPAAPQLAAVRSQSDWPARASWIFLAFVPSSLLLGVTSYVSADLAAVPLLWVVPLALYLISFIIAFGSRPPPLAALAVPLTAATSLSCGLLLANKLAFGAGLALSAWTIGLNFAAFFVIALVCHCAVAARRPPAERLTEFYVCLSTGGALGGVFNALLAPTLFSWTYEYEIGLALACAVRILLPGGYRSNRAQFMAPVLLLAAALAFPHAIADAGSETIKFAAASFTLFVLLALLFLGRNFPYAFAAGMAALLGGLAFSADRGALFTDRSFFGVHRVVSLENGKLVGFMHGSTLHGVAETDPAGHDRMLGYYAPEGPIGQVITARPGLARVGVVGLGAGALACYAKPGQDWTFFEIDPAVIAIARDTRYFHFLQDCGAPVRIAIGDGRLGLRDAATARYDLLVIDAFSSDSIPVHLLTREAFQLYAARLAPGGLLALHISNRFLDLRGVIAASAAAAGFSGLSQLYQPTPTEEARHVGASEWAVLARDPASLRPFVTDPRWARLPSAAQTRAWTDGFSDIFGAIR